MLFEKSTATSRFQIITLATAISSSLCGIYGAHPVTNCAFILSAWERRTKPQGMITSIMGLAALTEAHSSQRNYTALCAQDMSQTPRKELQSQIPDWKTEIWNYTCGHRLQALTLFFPWPGLYVLESIEIWSMSIYLFFKVSLKLK